MPESLLLSTAVSGIGASFSSTFPGPGKFNWTGGGCGTGLFSRDQGISRPVRDTRYRLVDYQYDAWRGGPVGYLLVRARGGPLGRNSGRPGMPTSCCAFIRDDRRPGNCFCGNAEISFERVHSEEFGLAERGTGRLPSGTAGDARLLLIPFNERLGLGKAGSVQELGECAIMKGAILANIQNRTMKSKNIHQTDDR